MRPVRWSASTSTVQAWKNFDAHGAAGLSDLCPLKQSSISRWTLIFYMKTRTCSFIRAVLFPKLLLTQHDFELFWKIFIDPTIPPFRCTFDQKREKNKKMVYVGLAWEQQWVIWGQSGLAAATQGKHIEVRPIGNLDILKRTQDLQQELLLNHQQWKCILEMYLSCDCTVIVEGMQKVRSGSPESLGLTFFFF